jgi:transposase
MDYVTAESIMLIRLAIDMSPAYVKGGAGPPRNAQIVFDKFHVVRGQAVNAVRRQKARTEAAERKS